MLTNGLEQTKNLTIIIWPSFHLHSRIGQCFQPL